MSKIVINGDVVLKRNNTTDAQGVAIPPTLESLGYGEVAINYNAKDACMFIKALDAAGQQKIVKFVGEEVIAKTLGDILGESAADLATLKEMIKLFEGSSSDVLTLVKNLQVEVALKANKTYVDTELGKKLGKTEKAADSNKIDGIDSTSLMRFTGVKASDYSYNDYVGLTVTNASASGASHTFDGDLAGSTFEGCMMHIGRPDAFGGTSFSLAVPTSSNQGLYYASYYNSQSSRRSWTRVYDKRNANLPTVDWSSRHCISYGNTRKMFSDNENVTAALISDDGSGGYIALYDSTGKTKAIFGANSGLELTSGGVVLSNSLDYKIKDNTGTARRVLSLDKNNDVYIGSMDTGLRDLYIRHNGINSIKITGINPTSTITLNSGKFGVNSITPTHQFESITSAQNIYAGYFYNSATVNGFGLYVRGGNSSTDRIATFQDRGGTNALLIYGDRNAAFLGNLGVGVATASAKFHVSGAVDGDWNARIASTQAVGKSNGLLIDAGTSENDTCAHFRTKGTADILKLRGDAKACFGGGKFDERVNIVGGNLAIGYGSAGTEAAPNWLGFKLKNYTGSDLFKLMIGDCSQSLHTGFFIIDQRKNDATGTFVRRFQITPYGETIIDSPTLRTKGNGIVDGNLRVLGETFTYSADGIETFEAGGGATRLADLTDVDLSGVQGNFVLYQSTETNANGDRIWKARSDAKTWSDISGKPTTFTPVEHNHIGSTYVTTPSDRALKTDLNRISSATNTILSLTPYTYNWTTQAMEVFGFKSHSSAGVIAQEIESIIPSAVTPLNGDYLSVDYIQIIPYLIGAFHELHAELQNKNIAITNATKECKRMYGANEKLAKRVTELEDELNNIKNQIAA